jgi:hypothetical protein
MRRSRAASAASTRAVAMTGRGLKVHTDEGPDAVRCLLCDRTYRAVNYMHLKMRHGFDGEHPVADYKRRFGLMTAACRATRRIMRRCREDYWEDRGQHWPRERVLAELRRRARDGRPLAPSRLGVAFALAVRHRFGTWDRAMRRAGLDPEAHRLTRRWDAARIAAAIRDRRAAHQPISASAVEREDYGLYRAAFREHRNWGRALRAAGLDPREHREPPKWSLDRAREWISASRAAGRPITTRLVPPGLVRRVGRDADLTWVEFVESLGIRYPGPHSRRDWTDAKVLAEIRERRRRGLPLNRNSVAENGQSLTHQARNRFGSWDGALRAAGIVPEEVRRHRTWTRADVLAAIRSRHSAGRPMDYASANADASRLVGAAQRMFPSSWARALKAAGLDPSLARRPAAKARSRRSHPR